MPARSEWPGFCTMPPILTAEDALALLLTYRNPENRFLTETQRHRGIESQPGLMAKDQCAALFEGLNTNLKDWNSGKSGHGGLLAIVEIGRILWLVLAPRQQEFRPCAC